jgi:hypothetical protein
MSENKQFCFGALFALALFGSVLLWHGVLIFILVKEDCNAYISNRSRRLCRASLR